MSRMFSKWTQDPQFLCEKKMLDFKWDSFSTVRWFNSSQFLYYFVPFCPIHLTGSSTFTIVSMPHFQSCFFGQLKLVSQSFSSIFKMTIRAMISSFGVSHYNTEAFTMTTAKTHQVHVESISFHWGLISIWCIK